MEILKNFGFDPVMMAAQIVNFLIIFYLLKRFLYKPFLLMLKKRQDEIATGIKKAEEGKKLLEEATKRELEILQKAEARAEKIIANSRFEVEEERKKTENAAKKEAERILTQARQTIEEETKEAEERLIKRVGEVALTLLEKSLKGMFGEKEQKVLLKKAVDRINQEKSI